MEKKKTVVKRKGTSEKKEKERAASAVALLKQVYPEAVCALEWGGKPEDGWKLLVMGRLSAQCTDARVNIVCRELFAKYPTLESLANAPVVDIEDIVRPCGLYRMKASDIKRGCTMLMEDYAGILPCEMDELLKLPGVGRKIANLLLGDIYHKPALVADTHCIRICGRLGFYPEDMKDPQKTERIMSKLIDPFEQSDFCHRIVQFGRDVCTARSPKCEECVLAEICVGKRTT